MSQKAICLLFIAALLLSIVPVIAPAGPQPASTPSVSSGGGGGGGSRQIDIDRLIKTVQDGKKNKPQKFDELAKLLSVKPFVTEDYNRNITFGFSVTGNGTLTRNDKFIVSATVYNPNPIEVRRVIYMNLEVMEPGEKAFRKVNSAPLMITNNEYDVNDEGMNISTRTFPELTSFSHLKTVGKAILRLQVSDGQYSWTVENNTQNVVNRPPTLENLTLQTPERPRFNDPIIYIANVTDLDGDLVNVTLHILDDQEKEIKNETQVTMPGKSVNFAANQYGFFNKEESGRNFSYYYIFSDGITINNTTVLKGPSLRKSASIWVGKPNVDPEENNQYWWQSYNFTLEMKNQDPGEAAVTVWLLTDTESHPWKMTSESQVVTLTQEPKMVYFNVKQPFDVLDANQTFGFRFKYTETDQHQQDHIDVTWGKPINAKLVRYHFISGLCLGNIIILLLMALMVSIFVERRFYR
jgi:hypothetical protein